MPNLSRPTRSPPRRGWESAHDAILAAAETVLLRSGEDALSIRSVAERSGYTASTVCDHFGDRTGLVDAVLEQHFRGVLRALTAVPRHPDPARYLHELGRAFVRFGLEHPQQYRLLTVQRIRHARVPSARAAHDLVGEVLGELLAEGTLATPDVETAFQILWATVHGLTSLYLLHPDDYGLAGDLLDRAFDVLETGLLRRSPSS